MIIKLPSGIINAQKPQVSNPKWKKQTQNPFTEEGLHTEPTLPACWIPTPWKTTPFLTSSVFTVKLNT